MIYERQLLKIMRFLMDWKITLIMKDWGEMQV